MGMKKHILTFGIMFLSLFAFASSWSDKAFYLVETESPKKIRRALETDYSFKDYTRSPENENLLMAALKSDRPNEVISMLLKAGISPDSKTKQGVTAFMYACQYETDMDAVRNVLQTGAFRDVAKRKRILRKDKNGLTSFDYARMNETHSEEVLEILLEYADEPLPQEDAADDTAEDGEVTEDAEEGALDEEPVAQATEELSDGSAPAPVAAVALAPAAAVAPIAAGAALASPSVAQAAAELPVESKMIDFSGLEVPPIVRESIYLYDYAHDTVTLEPIPAELIAAESAEKRFIPDANKRDSDGKTKLMIAAKKGDITRIEDLLFSGAEIDAKDDDGWTALMYAARFQSNPDVTKLLLIRGADRSLKNKYGITPLLLSAGYAAKPEVVSTLLESYPANSDEAREAFAYGISNLNTPSVLQAFIDKQVPLNVPYDGKTPLMVACETNKNTHVIEWLLDNGASKYQIEATTGKTAYDYAKENKKLPHNVVYWSLNPNS